MTNGTSPFVTRLACIAAIVGLLSACATIKDTAQQGVETAEEIAGSAIDLTKSAATTIGELTIELINKPIDFVRGNLLYGETDAAGRTVLHYAVADKDLEETERLLDEGAPRKYDAEGFEPYHLAIVQNDPEFLRLFASYRQELDKPTENGIPPQHLASGADAAESFRWLLMAGLDPEMRDSQGLDAVQYGISANRSRFLETGADYIDLNRQDATGDGYIHYATKTRNAAAIDQLVTLGVDVDQPNIDGHTALMLAVTQPRSDQVAQTLILRGSNIDMADPSGDTPVIRSIRANLPQNLSLLVDAGANANTPDINGLTPAFIALPTNNGDHILQLARAGVNFNQYDSEGFAPMHRAVAGNFPRVIEPLAESGAVVDVPLQNKGVTPLMLAARIGLSKIQSALEKLGASNEARDIAGNTALHYAAGFDRSKSINVALAGGADIHAINARGETPIHSAIYRTSSTAFKQLLKKQPDIAIRDLQGNQPLHAALYTGNLNFARDLIKQQAPVDSPNAEGLTPLVSSIRHNNLDMIDVLINNKDNKASLVLTDEEDHHPIHEAAIHDRPEAIIMLARAKSPVNPLNIQGLTPLHIAAAKGHDISIRALLRNGAFIDARDPDLNTPLHLATAADKPNAVQELMRSGADARLRNLQLQSPIFTALEAGSIDSFAPILRDSYANIRNPQGDTSLMAALKQGKFNAAMRLLKLGVSPLYGNPDGTTPLHLAYELQNTRLIGELANAGADLSTPLKPQGHDFCDTPIADLTANNQQAEQQAQLQNQDDPNITDALPEPGPMEGWRSDCLLFMNDTTYLGKRARWLMLGRTPNYVASRWWQRIPLSPARGDNTIAQVTADAQAKLAYYLSYAKPDQYLPPLSPPVAPLYAEIKRLADESEAAYLERLDYYTREYQGKYENDLTSYKQRKQNRLERIAQMKALHLQRDIQPKRPAISFTADALQYHYNRPFRASNGVLDTVHNTFIIEIPVTATGQTLIVNISESEYPDHFAYLRRDWQRLPWYIGTVVTPDSFTFTEVATLAPEGMVFLPLDTEAPGSVKVLVHKFNAF